MQNEFLFTCTVLLFRQVFVEKFLCRSQTPNIAMLLKTRGTNVNSTNNGEKCNCICVFSYKVIEKNFSFLFAFFDFAYVSTFHLFYFEFICNFSYLHFLLFIGLGNCQEMPDHRTKSSIAKIFANDELRDDSFRKRSQSSLSPNAHLNRNNQLQTSDASIESFHDLDGYLLSRPDYHKVLHQRIKYKINVYDAIRRLEVDKNDIFQRSALKDRRYLNLVQVLQQKNKKSLIKCMGPLF